MEPKYPVPPKGLICPVITPLKEDHTLDLRSFESLLGHIERHVDGILLADPIWGEGHLLPGNTRHYLVKSALETIRGRCAVFINITGQDLENTFAFMADVESFINRIEYPGNLFWVDCPLLYHSNRGLPQMYRDLMTQTRFPMVIENLPALVHEFKRPVKHKNIRTAVLKKMAQHPAINGIIYTGNLKRSFNYHAAVRFRNDFTFYDGDELVFLKNPGMGGVVAGGSNLTPVKWYEITKSSLHRSNIGGYDSNRQSSLWETGIMLHSLYSLYSGAPAYYMKRMLREIGIIERDHTILPGKPESPKWLDNLKTFLESYRIV